MDVKKTKKPFAACRTPYNIFRGAFRMFTYTWEQIMMITISTCGQITVLLPELRSDPSRRARGSSQFMEKFVLVDSYSVNNAEISRFINAEMFQRGKFKGKDGINNWLDFLESEFRIHEYFKFGRPLIYGYFKQYELENLLGGKYDLEAPFENCKEFWSMAVKLFGGRKYGGTDNIQCLYGLFNFTFGTNFLPAYIRKEEIVENYLMTLVDYQTDEKDEYEKIM